MSNAVRSLQFLSDGPAQAEAGTRRPLEEYARQAAAR